jgi:hypothetical protein
MPRAAKPHPVTVCVHKGNPKRFFGKYKSPKDGRWLKIPGGPFPPVVDNKAKAQAFATRWYEAQILLPDAPRPLVSWANVCDSFVEDVAARLRGSDATKDEARMKAMALRSHELLAKVPVAQHDETLLVRWLRWFGAEPVTKRGGVRAPRDGFTVRNYVKVLRDVYRFAKRRDALKVCAAPANSAEFEHELKALLAPKKRREVMLEPAAIARLLECPGLGEFRRTWVALLAYTGLRPGEAHGLRVDDVRIANRVRHLKVERQFKLPRTNIEARVGPLKTRHANRMIRSTRI